MCSCFRPCRSCVKLLPESLKAPQDNDRHFYYAYIALMKRNIFGVTSKDPRGCDAGGPSASWLQHPVFAFCSQRPQVQSCTCELASIE